MQEFEYRAPSTIREAVELLADPVVPARVLAGGTDLLIQLRAGQKRVARLVDVKRIEALNELACDRTDGLSIGAAVPCWRLVEHRLARELYPGLCEAAALIGSDQIQSRATIAGNLCNASPAADTAPALIALTAQCVVAGLDGERTIPVADLATAPGRHRLAPEELLVAVHVPPPAARSADCYLRLIPRNEMDIAVVGAAVALAFEGERCSAARIALGAVGPTPLLALDAARCLVGTPVDEEALGRAAESAMVTCAPISDMRSPEEYRRAMVGVLVRRAGAEAARRARLRPS